MLSSFAFPEPPKVAEKKRNRIIDDASSSMQDLSELIGRLSAQLEKLETEKKSDVDGGSVHDKFIINPLAADVVQAYDTLLQQTEHLTHHCCCCADIVEAAPGIPWFAPYNKHRPNEDPLQVAYTHWCTLMRCLPVMDAAAQTYVRTIGHYAMRQLMHAMRGNTRYVASPPLQRHSQYQGSSHTLLSNRTSNSGSSTLAPVLLKNSSSCLNDMPQETTTLRTKADAWVPQRLMMDENSTTGYHHHHFHHQHERTAPVPNSTSSPLPAPSNTTFTSPLINRPYHATKLRRWFKRHNKVAPVNNRQEPHS